MKILKIALVVILVLVLAVVIAMFVAPTEMHVERSVDINAPKAIVHKHVSSFALMNEWSPWAKLDPNMKSEIIGEDGTVGAINKWEGNEDVGKGEQEFSMISYDTITTLLRFKEPFESYADVYIVVDETSPSTTKVTWGFKSTMTRPFNIMGLFMDMDAAIGNDYQKGLDSLKAITEAEAANKTYNGYKVEEVTFPETHFAITRDTVKWDAMEAYFGTKLPAAYAAVMQANMQPGTPCGVYYTWDTENQQADMGVGVAISPAGEVPGLQTVTISGNALKVNYYGAYDKVGEAHAGIDEYIAERSLTPLTPIVELYITDPGTEPDTTKWLTEVYYLIK